MNSTAALDDLDTLRERMRQGFARERRLLTLVPRIQRTPVPIESLPPETIQAVADVWTAILLADLERHPPRGFSLEDR